MVESDRWALFRSHYGFDVFYCAVPAWRGAHEKGGVEGEGGRFRRTHTVPMPKVETLAELNAYLARCDAKDDHRRVGQRISTVGDDFATEQALLRALPAEPSTLARPAALVDRHARVTVRQCQYFGARLLRRPPVATTAPRHQRADLRRAPAGRNSRTLHHPRQRHPAWTTTWKCWPTSPARCPARPHSSRPARPGCSPAPTSGTGWRRKPATATRPAPRPWWKPCCCTAPTPMAKYWPAPRPRSPWARCRPRRSLWRSVAPVRPAPARPGHRRGPDRLPGRHPADPDRGRLRHPAHQRKPPHDHDPQAVEVAIDTACRTLRLPTIRERAAHAAQVAAREQHTYQDFLAELLLAECDDRDERRRARRVHEAGFPRPKRLDEIDYQANPNLNPAVINTLAGGEWVAKASRCA